MAEVVKVKRDGERGWHWISAASYDPDVHELADEAPKPVKKARKNGA